MAQNAFLQYFVWQFFDAPKNILAGWVNFLRFGVNFFSIPLLLKTLFSPWRKYSASYGRGFDVGRFFETLLSNLIFRLLGAIVRSFFILAGILFEGLIFIVGLAILIIWLLLPAVLILGIYHGFRIAF
ncbi:MAG: hypothetical protein Q7S70_00775 [bacterium]|nr:hypothetical protein [bacterium]